MSALRVVATHLKTQLSFKHLIDVRKKYLLWIEISKQVSFEGGKPIFGVKGNLFHHEKKTDAERSCQMR